MWEENFTGVSILDEVELCAAKRYALVIDRNEETHF